MNCQICGNEIERHPIGGYWYHTTVSVRHIPLLPKFLEDKKPQTLSEKIKYQEESLRDLACYLGVGGYNDEGLSEFDAEKYVAKIKEGIESFVNVESERKLRYEYQKCS